MKMIYRFESSANIFLHWMQGLRLNVLVLAGERPSEEKLADMTRTIPATAKEIATL